MSESFYNAISGLVDGRVHYGKIDQETAFPAIVYTRITTQVGTDLSGCINYQSPTYQIDIYGYNPSELRTIEGQVTTALQSDDFQVVKLNDFEDYESDTRLHRVSVDYSVWE